MKIETVKSHNVLKIAIAIGLVMGIVLVLKTSKADFSNGRSIPLVDRDVYYEAPDMNVTAIYLESSKGVYDLEDDVPQSGYVLNEESSYCKIGNEDETRLDNIKIIYEEGALTIGNITKRGTKCYIYFDKEETDEELIDGKINLNVVVKLINQDETLALSEPLKLYIGLFRDKELLDKVELKEVVIDDTKEGKVLFDELETGIYYYAITNELGEKLENVLVGEDTYVFSDGMADVNGKESVVLELNKEVKEPSVVETPEEEKKEEVVEDPVKDNQEGDSSLTDETLEEGSND